MRSTRHQIEPEIWSWWKSGITHSPASKFLQQDSPARVPKNVQSSKRHSLVQQQGNRRQNGFLRVGDKRRLPLRCGGVDFRPSTHMEMIRDSVGHCTFREQKVGPNMVQMAKMRHSRSAIGLPSNLRVHQSGQLSMADRHFSTAAPIEVTFDASSAKPNPYFPKTGGILAARSFTARIWNVKREAKTCKSPSDMLLVCRFACPMQISAAGPVDARPKVRNLFRMMMCSHKFSSPQI